MPIPSSTPPDFPDVNSRVCAASKTLHSKLRPQLPPTLHNNPSAQITPPHRSGRSHFGSALSPQNPPLPLASSQPNHTSHLPAPSNPHSPPEPCYPPNPSPALAPSRGTRRALAAIPLLP